MADRFVDLINGNNANDGSSFANRVKTIDSSGMSNARHNAGDRIKVMKSPDPTQLSNNATWTNASATMTLGAAVNKTVDTCDAAWTAAANVTATTSSSTPKQGTGNTANLVIASGFTTGKIAYKGLGASNDFSAYQQVCFWIKTSGDIAASSMQLKLCSDTTGDTPVNTLTIPFAVSSSNGWHAVVIDNGSALGSAIQSVALYASSDPGAITVNLDIIFASKAPSSADCITLHTLIAKSNAPSGNNGWYGIAYVNGTTLGFDAARNSTTNPATFRTYEGTTETVATYVRQCIPFTNTGAFIVPTKDGTEGNVITYSGGWDTTNMSTQDGETWICNVASASALIAVNIRSFHTWEKWGFAFWNNAALESSAAVTALTFDSCHFCNIASTIFSCANGGGWLFTSCRAFNCTAGFGLNNVPKYPHMVKNCVAVGTYSGAGFVCTPGTKFINCVSRNNSTFGFQFSTGNNQNDYSMEGCSSNLNGTAGVQFNATTLNRLNLVNCTISDSTKFTIPTSGQDTTIYSENDGNSAGVHLITNFSYTINGQTATRHTASGIAWKINPTDSNLNSLNPVKLRIAEAYFNAGSLATVKVWVRRSNTALIMKLIAPAIADRITTDSIATISASADTWEELTITFTPAVAGVIPIYVYAYGGTTHSGYVDDITISQA